MPRMKLITDKSSFQKPEDESPYYTVEFEYGTAFGIMELHRDHADIYIGNDQLPRDIETDCASEEDIMSLVDNLETFGLLPDKDLLDSFNAKHDGTFGDDYKHMLQRGIKFNAKFSLRYIGPESVFMETLRKRSGLYLWIEDRWGENTRLDNIAIYAPQPTGLIN